jgi:hypothetical protein
LNVIPVTRGRRVLRKGVAPVHATPAPAEFWSVQAAAPGFSRVLDEKLAAACAAAATRPVPPPAAGRPWAPVSFRPVLDPGVLHPPARAFARSYGSPPPSGQTLPSWNPARQSCSLQPDSRPARRLAMTTTSQRHALDTLRRLGASDLGHDITDVDLKRAFRRLARRYHPDARPDIGAAEHQRLAASFRELRDAYRTLMAAFPLG